MFGRTHTHVHFVGIGGIGMSGIAEVLLTSGYRVTGSDAVASETTTRLAHLGARVLKGHGADHLGDADVVVVSSAIRPDNPEVLAARARRIPVIPRAEMLGELMRLRQGIAIAGSHGKTTTTSLIAAVLHEAGMDPTVVIGGVVNSFHSNARAGQGDILVAEADESDGSFLRLSPTMAVITNIDNEHLDHYRNMENLVDAFASFADRVPFYGLAVLCADDPTAASMLPRLTKRTVTYGVRKPADYLASDVRHDGPSLVFHARGPGGSLGEFSLGMPGVHNAQNALAALAVGEAHGIPLTLIRRALAGFEGVQRRFTIRGTCRGITVVDDYGHHPTEIRATLSGARASFPGRRLVCVLQPHRYTRLRDNMSAFAEALDEADVLVLTGVYAAGEEPIAGVTVERLAQIARALRPERALFVEPELERVAGRLVALLHEGDVVVTLGAGTITRASRALVAALSEGP
jgi:UDP-N-acetylmuramate--alanine ligase